MDQRFQIRPDRCMAPKYDKLQLQDQLAQPLFLICEALSHGFVELGETMRNQYKNHQKSVFWDLVTSCDLYKSPINSSICGVF